jgi:hypothetical protein
LDEEVDNEITLLAFRLLVSDLLELFHVVNEGVINVLEHYFEMSRYDAERSLRIYKVFTEQTADVVEFLQSARRVETSTRLQIPNIKHAPTSLTSSLEEYLNDPDFDVNRQQYLAQKNGKENGGGAKSSQAAASSNTSSAQQGPTPTESKEPRKIAPDLIDFFESIETEQTPMFANQPAPQQQQQIAAQMTGVAPQMMTNPYQQQQQMYGAAPPQLPNQTGFYQQNNNPFPPIAAAPEQPVQSHFTGAVPVQPVQSHFTGAVPVQPVQSHFTGTGFGGYTPQDQQHVIPEMPVVPPQYVAPPPPPAPAPAALQVPAQTGHNPFRQSMLLAQSTGGPPKSTNPFARTSQISPSPTGAQSPPRGTNPFTRISPQPTGSALTVPGGTNPFRASMMLHQQQAQMQAQMQGNFSGQTGTMGGLENVETMPVFPRSNTTAAGTPPTNGGWQ